MIVLYLAANHENGKIYAISYICGPNDLIDFFNTLDEEKRDGLSSDWLLYGIYDLFGNWDFSFNIWDVARLYCEYFQKAKTTILEEEEIIKTLNFMQCDEGEIDELYDTYSAEDF